MPIYSLPVLTTLLLLIGSGTLAAAATVDNGVIAKSHGAACWAIKSSVTPHKADYVSLDWSAFVAAGAKPDYTMTLSWGDNSAASTRTVTGVKNTITKVAYNQPGPTDFGLAFLDNNDTQPAQTVFEDVAMVLPPSFTFTVTDGTNDMQASASFDVRDCTSGFGI